MRALPLAGVAGLLIFAAFGAPPAAAQTTAPTADGRGVAAVADSADNTDSGTFTLDSEVSKLLTQQDNTIAVLRGNGK